MISTWKHACRDRITSGASTMQAYLGRWFPLRGVGNTPAKPSDSTCFTTAIKRKGKRGNYIVKRGEKGTYYHDDIVTLNRTNATE